MENIVIIVHIIVALAIIGLVLLQQGKGAEAGASLGGGASQTVFGSQGGGNFFVKVTAILAAVFFATSFSLAIIAKNNSSVSSGYSDIPTPVEEVPVDTNLVEQKEEQKKTANEAGDVPVVVKESAAPEVPSSAPVEVPEKQ
jgi:preprotein translocase subunit SecG